MILKKIYIYIYKQKYMTDKPGLTSRRTNNLGDELILKWSAQVTKAMCIIAPIEFFSGCKYFQWKKKSNPMIDALIQFIL